MYLTEEQIAQFRKHGFLLVKGMLAPDVASQLPQWVDEVTSAPLVPGKQMVYLEASPSAAEGKTISRIEKFLEIQQQLHKLAVESSLTEAVSDLFEQPAVIFKDKINYQPPGGGGILPHQDIQAGWLEYAETFISVAITVDASTEENGCTEIDTSWRSTGLIGTLWEPLNNDHMKSIEFTKFPTEPGDVIFFDGFVPHQAQKNQSDTQRRIMFFTYNPQSEGEHYQKYYTDKRASFPPDNERDPEKQYVFRV